MASLLDALETSAREGCAFIMLNHGKFALLDEEDLERVEELKWFYVKHGYATATCDKHPYMHRIVMNAPKGSRLDHWSRDKLDNRKQNLRWCDGRKNQGNAVAKKRKDGSSHSIYKGVTLYQRNERCCVRWQARGNLDYKSVSLGYYKTQIEAARAYDRWALESFGEFARINGV